MAGTFFTTGNTHANESEARVFQRFKAAHGVTEIGIASINDDVMGIQDRAQMADHLINRITGFDQQNNGARRANGGL